MVVVVVTTPLAISVAPITHFTDTPDTNTSSLADTNTDTDTRDPWAESIKQFQQRTQKYSISTENEIF